MRYLSRAFMVAAVVALLVGAVSIAAAQDWPQWRGPARDGVAAAFDVPSSWPDMLQRHWSLEIGLGYASPVLIGDRLYLFTRQGDDEVMTALDAATGETLWRTSYAAPFDMNPSTRAASCGSEVHAHLRQRPPLRARHDRHRDRVRRGRRGSSSGSTPAPVSRRSSTRRCRPSWSATWSSSMSAATTTAR